MADFSVSRQSTDAGRTVLGVIGELDVASVPAMRAAGVAALAESGCSTLVLDVTGLTLIDSSGIGALVELRTYAQEHEQGLVLRGVSQNLARVLTIAGITSLFDIEAGGPI